MKMERLNTIRSLHTENTLDLDDVGFGVDGKEILKDLSFNVTASRIGIVGRNGSGKSTLARMLAGLIAPSTGKVRVNKVDLVRDRKAALSDVGILFQNPDHQIIFPTVDEEIAFGLVQQGHSKRSAANLTAETLADFSKSHWSDAHISTLSQGQKHLVCMMAIIAMQPKLIVLDEPFTGLDIPTKKQLTRYLTRYQGGLVHISHDPSDLREYNELIWLEDGRLKTTGAAKDVLSEYEAEMSKLGGLDDISNLAN